MGDTEKDKKQRSFLSKRQKSIIFMLLQMNAEPITVAAISEKLGVSSRTILRELPTIEQWLSDNDFKFKRTPGIGLFIDEEAENLQLIEELLTAENIIPVFGKKERCRKILGELLFSSEPIKTYVFTSQFNISEKTLFGDLDVLETWLSEYQIRIVRRTGLGIFLEGDEINLRQAIANAVFEFCDLDKIPTLLGGADAPTIHEVTFKPALMIFLENDILSFTKHIIKECEKKLHVTYVDSSRLRLTLRVALAIYRMKNGKYLKDEEVNHENVKLLSEYTVGEFAADEIEKYFNLEMTSAEKDYIVMHLSTTRIWSDASELKDPIQVLGIRQVVMSMVGIAGQMTSIPFYKDQQLIEDLSVHIVSLRKRSMLNVITEDTETTIVKQNYPEIYQAAKVASQVLRDWLKPAELKSADIGYIAMHFAVAAERFQENKQKISVVLTCPSGFASSKLLSVALEKAFSNILIRKTISAFQINEQELYDEGIDFIISTVELETNFPYICVEKMLQTQDKARIQNTIEKINSERLQGQFSEIEKKTVPFTIDNIKKQVIVGTEILELINHFSVCDVEKVSNKEELLLKAAETVADCHDNTQKIHEGFLKREALGDGYVKEMNIYLFHCETDAVEHNRFSYISLGTPLETKKGVVEGAVAMVVPNHKDEIYKEPVGRLSALLVEEPGFLQVLKRSDSIAGLAYVEKALVKYYKNLK